MAIYYWKLNRLLVIFLLFSLLHVDCISIHLESRNVYKILLYRALSLVKETEVFAVPAVKMCCGRSVCDRRTWEMGLIHMR